MPTELGRVVQIIPEVQYPAITGNLVLPAGRIDSD